MERQGLEAWLRAYGRAWETSDPDAAVALFASDATYHDTPFSEVMSGRDAIHAYWSRVPEFQEDISFTFDVWSVDPAIAGWRTRYVAKKTGITTTLDGVFLLTFGSDGSCTSLREWWHADPAPSF